MIHCDQLARLVRRRRRSFRDAILVSQRSTGCCLQYGLYPVFLAGDQPCVRTTLIRNAKWCRDHGTRVEGPDQALQFSQLAAIHAHWTAQVEATSIDDTGPRISGIAVEPNPINMHLVCERPLFRNSRAIVNADALTLQHHDPNEEVMANILPPIVEGPLVQPLAFMKVLPSSLQR